MADYERMYALLCGAIDQVIDPLEQIPLAWPEAAILRQALEEAEECYLRTTPYAENREGERIIRWHIDALPEDGNAE